MVWTGITLLSFVARITLDVCRNDNLKGKPKVLGKTHFLHLSAVSLSIT
jgi:hypothetical protein